MHMLVFGATSPTGIIFVDKALLADHRLTVYVRSPSKLPDRIASHKHVKVIAGTLNNLVAVRQAIAEGASIVVSFLGPNFYTRAGDTAVTDFYRVLFPLLASSETVRRVFTTATPSFPAAADAASIKWTLLRTLVSYIARGAYDEAVGIGEVTTSAEGIEWTLMRVLKPYDGEAKPVRAALLGQGREGLWLSRKTWSSWILEELKERQWVNQAPTLSDAI